VVGNAIKFLEIAYLERRKRELKTLIEEANRRGDEVMLRKLEAENMQIDRRLRVLT
jgi:DNA primase